MPATRQLGWNAAPPFRPPPVSARGLRRAVALALAAVVSFFLALAYAYLERHGWGLRAARYAWFTTPLATLLAANTLLLFASSLALRRARQWLACAAPAAVLHWLAVTIALGVGFLAGQAAAWRLLWRAGVFVANAPDSAFFYLLTAAHALHLGGGLALLGYVFSRALRGRLRPERPLALELTALVWHTLAAAWAALFLLLVCYR